MIGIKLYEELCSRGTQCLYIEGEMKKSSYVVKMTKNDLTIISKLHAIPHTIKKKQKKKKKKKKKTCVKFQNDGYKTERFALTRDTQCLYI